MGVAGPDPLPEHAGSHPCDELRARGGAGTHRRVRAPGRAGREECRDEVSGSGSRSPAPVPMQATVSAAIAELRARDARARRLLALMVDDGDEKSNGETWDAGRSSARSGRPRRKLGAAVLFDEAGLDDGRSAGRIATRSRIRSATWSSARRRSAPSCSSAASSTSFPGCGSASATRAATCRLSASPGLGQGLEGRQGGTFPGSRTRRSTSIRPAPAMTSRVFSLHDLLHAQPEELLLGS